MNIDISELSEITYENLKNYMKNFITKYMDNIDNNKKKIFYLNYAYKYENTEKLLENIEKTENLLGLKIIFIDIKYIISEFNKNEEPYTKKKRKKNISSTIKRLVWNTHIGEEIGKTKCLCCKTTDIRQLSFNCGHIIAEAHGGSLTVSNLKPICQNCNSSMGTQNMNDFMKSFN